MVNKHYTVQRQQQNSLNTKRFSPPPVRNPSLISNAPNPTHVNSLDEVNNFGETRERKVLDTIREERKSGKAKNSAYGVNITLANKMIGNHNTKKGPKGSKEEQTQQPRGMANDNLEINDIGRFQYILQMDKEMGTHPDKLYRIPPRIQMPANRQSSINSTNHNGHFWKAGSETPITTPSSNSGRQRDEIYRYFVNFWKYAKWPLLIILCALLLGTSIYFVVADSNRPSKTPLAANFTDIDIPTESSVEANIVQEDNSTIEDSVGDENWELKLSSESTEDELSSIETTTETRTTSTSSTTYRTHSRVTNPSTIFRTKSHFQQHATHIPYTTVSHTRNTKILPIHTYASIQFEEDIRSTTEVLRKNKESNVEPTKDTFDIIGFTSGHQNSFGIPIEEDERILRILNEELMKHQAEEVNRTHKPTTDSSVNHPRVSPTLPVVSRGIYSTTERLSPVNQSDNGNCQSTSLSICRGILQYDLTMNKSGKALSPKDEADFKELFDSSCSNRAAEFVCSVLEPECRPSQMGILRPCKRICRSILEECVLAIGTSDLLLSIFDCDSYPDSSDRNVCEDPTRRGRCLDDEFKCLDSTCIPQRWKCDNIKDCSLGEDEENCLHCDTGEFRCQSMDKCVPYKWRCDTYQDCADGSDEMDCYDYEDDSTSSDNPREFAYASVQEPNSPKNKPYLIISADGSNPEQEEESEPYDDRFLPTSPDNESEQNDSDRREDEESQKGEASSRVLVGVPKSIANFQDSKEIMMTSDTENDFKYSKINQTISSTTVRTEELTPGPSQCPEGELRCVSGECIKVEQICDKIVDCPDGADEAMCVYKETS